MLDAAICNKQQLEEVNLVVYYIPSASSTRLYRIQEDSRRRGKRQSLAAPYRPFPMHLSQPHGEAQASPGGGDI
jgi:hypothetical protein